MRLDKLVRDIISGYHVSREEAMKLWEIPIAELLSSSSLIRESLCGNQFDICTIINAKSGLCSEDCKYCAQSAHYNTGVKTFDILDEDIILEDALINFSKVIKRYSLVTSGKSASENEIEKLCSIFKSISQACDIKLCSSSGLLNYEQLKKLKDSGVSRVHNNLESSREFFKNICTTHSYDEKIQTIKAAMEAGMEVCSGGIIGLGESRLDRVSLAFELKELKIKSIPLNLLNPIEGTPLYENEVIGEEEFLRTAAIFRFINPDAIIRLAGGRNLLFEHGIKAFKSSVNGTISGELLTTYGSDTQKDLSVIRGLGYEINY